jgi:hypothetical protein
MSVIPRCSKSVYPAGMNWPRPRQCEREGKVQRTGQWFCRQHDPEKVAEKHDEAHNQFLKRQREQEGIKATAENLAKRLGFGKGALLQRQHDEQERLHPGSRGGLQRC